MTATEQITKMHAEVMAELKLVRAEHTSLQQGAALMAKHHSIRIEEAYAEEAKERLRRGAWKHGERHE
jgi:hypothetical protein